MRSVEYKGGGGGGVQDNAAECRRGSKKKRGLKEAVLAVTRYRFCGAKLLPYENDKNTTKKSPKGDQFIFFDEDCY